MQKSVYRAFPNASIRPPDIPVCRDGRRVRGSHRSGINSHRVLVRGRHQHDPVGVYRSLGGAGQEGGILRVCIRAPCHPIGRRHETPMEKHKKF